MKLKHNFSYIRPAILMLISVIGVSTVAASNDGMSSGSLMQSLERDNKVKKSFYPSRLDKQKERRCKSCEERERDTRFEYLSRVIAENSSSEYQKQVKRLVLADEKFVRNCWSRLSKRETEVFFTINEDGRAEDVAWFPKRTFGKCLSKHVTKIEFPKPPRTHYSWIVTSEVVVMDFN